MSSKYDGYTLRDIMVEGLGDAVKAHMLKLWNVAMSADQAHRDEGVAAVREGYRKIKRMYEGGMKLIEEEFSK